MCQSRVKNTNFSPEQHNPQATEQSLKLDCHKGEPAKQRQRTRGWLVAGPDRRGEKDHASDSCQKIACAFQVTAQSQEESSNKHLAQTDERQWKTRGPASEPA